MPPMRSAQRCRDLLLTVAVNAVSAPPGNLLLRRPGGHRRRAHARARSYAVAARRPNGDIAICTDVLRSRVYTRRHLAPSVPSWRCGTVRDDPPGHARAAVVGDRPARSGRGDRRGCDPRGDDRLARVRARAVHRAAAAARRICCTTGQQSITSVLIEGVIRAVVLVAYLVLISLIPNVRRLFQYHGAEHMAINALESGDAIDVDHVRARSRLHPRCGTGFLVVVAFVSVAVFAPLGLLPTAVRLVLQIVLVPVVAAVSYEIIRALIRIRGTAPSGRIALAPVLGAQLLSTRQPGRLGRSRSPSPRLTPRVSGEGTCLRNRGCTLMSETETDRVRTAPRRARSEICRARGAVERTRRVPGPRPRAAPLARAGEVARGRRGRATLA